MFKTIGGRVYWFGSEIDYHKLIMYLDDVMYIVTEDVNEAIASVENAHMKMQAETIDKMQKELDILRKERIKTIRHTAELGLAYITILEIYDLKPSELNKILDEARQK